MPQQPISAGERKRREDAIHACLEEGFRPRGMGGQGLSAVYEAARRLGIPAGTMSSSISNGLLEIDWSRYKPREQPSRAASSVPIPPQDPDALDKVFAALRRRPMSLREIAEAAGITAGQALDALDAARTDGLNVHQAGELWSIESAPAPAFASDSAHMFEYVSRPDNTFYFGACGDNHLASKYERLDVLNDLYDRFASYGVDRVFNTGNWIDGEAKFNKYDLKIHGMDAQCRYLAEHYPRRSGLETFAVAGDDHEGWYGQREGVDIGRYAENRFHDAGRADWHNLGYMEAHVKLVNANSGKFTMLAVVHPGGGSAYALSYSIQKIIESLDGGEKPAVGLYGHYHKLWAGNIRNVWVCQTGTSQDQTPFMRKKKLEAHVGGVACWLEQDPETGAIISMCPQLIRYFTKSYYNDRWSHAHEVALPARGP